MDSGAPRIPDIKSENNFDSGLHHGNGISGDVFSDIPRSGSPQIFSGPSENEQDEVNKNVRKLLRAGPDPIEHSVTVSEKLGLREPIQNDVYFDKNSGLILFDSKIAL